MPSRARSPSIARHKAQNNEMGLQLSPAPPFCSPHTRLKGEFPTTPEKSWADRMDGRTAPTRGGGGQTISSPLLSVPHALLRTLRSLFLSKQRWPGLCNTTPLAAARRRRRWRRSAQGWGQLPAAAQKSLSVARVMLWPALYTPRLARAAVGPADESQLQSMPCPT